MTKKKIIVYKHLLVLVGVKIYLEVQIKAKEHFGRSVHKHILLYFIK